MESTKQDLDIFDIKDEYTFNRACLHTFAFQYQNVHIYRQYVDLLGINPHTIEHYTQIPFLPIQFFKSQEILAKKHTAEIIFTSSGTTGMTTSRHLVASKKIYEESYNKAFTSFYGPAKDTAILALLPSYLERDSSSLIYMVDDLIRQSAVPQSGYFLYNHEDLYQTLLQLQQHGTKTILLGVTYALLDFVENYQVNFPDLIVMETGGMKGKRKEMIRQELHQILSDRFGVPAIHSEYGMTELLSQGYSTGNGIFRTPPWMKILIRDTNDPLSLAQSHKTGAINVIDLANYYSCSFISTQDLGKLHDDHSFEVLGRFDHADVRGCNLLVHQD